MFLGTSPAQGQKRVAWWKNKQDADGGWPADTGADAMDGLDDGYGNTDGGLDSWGADGNMDPSAADGDGGDNVGATGPAWYGPIPAAHKRPDGGPDPGSTGGAPGMVA